MSVSKPVLYTQVSGAYTYTLKELESCWFEALALETAISKLKK